MIHHDYNEERSCEVYGACKSQIEIKDCYRNIFRVLPYYYDRFDSGEWKIAYGYIQCFDNIYARHCFILDEENRVIDPTTILTESKIGKRESHDYISFQVLCRDEWIKLIEENGFYPSLTTSFVEAESDAYKYSQENGLIFVG